MLPNLPSEDVYMNQLVPDKSPLAPRHGGVGVAQETAEQGLLMMTDQGVICVMSPHGRVG